MTLARAARAVAWSVVVCTGTVLLMAALIQAGQVGGSLRAILDMTTYFSLTYAAVAVVILLPVFMLLERATDVLQKRTTAALIGAALAAFASLALVVVVFRTPADPQTIGGWISFWTGNLVPFAAGLAPFLAGGATFGLKWTAPAPVPVESSPVRRGRGPRRKPQRKPVVSR
jgi:hypothetical protein